jgi:hypothetical protein
MVGALALFGAFWARPSLAAASGDVLGLSGTATIETGGQQRPLAIGDPVQTGDTINVPQDSKVRLRMTDGSILTIASGSKMTIDKYDVDGSGTRQTAELSMSAGLLRAVVSAGGGTPNFEVKTATGVASVRGTEWYIDTQDNKTQVYVVSGNVTLTDARGQGGVTVTQMATSLVTGQQEPSQIRPITPLELQTLIQRTSLGMGLCQCIGARSDVMANCRSTTDACQAFCGSQHYSFVPSAPESCGPP